VQQHADILSQPEWKSLGYEYVNIGITLIFALMLLL
jgi:hypothetical protein